MGVESIMVAGEHISQLYIEYTKSMLNVNRTYQRKLVWTLEEKQKLIDTILKGYPVPLFLFVSRKTIGEDGKVIKTREIIDGLQRLEAIISFINNKFPVVYEGEERYFDLSSFSGATLKVLRGELHQKEPILDNEVSNAFANYFLAVTTIDADEVGVEDVFKRINSTGRQLSPQELRQAGVISKFSSVVQNIASRLRGDYTEQDILPLEDMEKYSLSSRELDYGIDIRDVFWTKQGIINFDSLRRSKDEEIIANLCNCILNDYSTSISKKVLDTVYDDSSPSFKRNETSLTEGKQIWLQDKVLNIFEDFKAALKESGITFKQLVTNNEKSSNTDLVFIVLFLAVSQLKDEGYIFSDYRGLAKCLKGIADAEMSDLIKSDSSWNRDIRSHLVERTKTQIRKCMQLNHYSPEMNEKFYSLLAAAAAEEQMYDFKLGITNLKDDHFNSKVVEKCLQTLTAMANTKPGEEGHIIFGIANDKNACADFEEHYHTPVRKVNDLYVTGIESEARKYYNDVDGYLRKIKTAIESLKDRVSEGVVDEILKNMSTARCDERTLVVLSLSANEPVFFDKQLFVRYQSNNQLLEAGSREYLKVIESFYKHDSKQEGRAVSTTSFF